MALKQIILYTILVLFIGAALYAGYNFIQKSSDASNRERLMADIERIAKNAQDYYTGTDNMGFSQRSYEGWNIPGHYKDYNFGTFNAKVSDQKILLSGIGKEKGKNGISNVKVKATITPESIEIKILN